VAVGAVAVGKTYDGEAVGSSPPQAISKRSANDPVSRANRFKEIIGPTSMLPPTGQLASSGTFPSVRIYVLDWRWIIETMVFHIKFLMMQMDQPTRIVI